VGGGGGGKGGEKKEAEEVSDMNLQEQRVEKYK